MHNGIGTSCSDQAQASGLLLGRNHYNHAFPLEHGHLLHFSKLLQVIGETQQKHFTLLLKQD